ncbi:MAG: glutathione S-transferase [Pseudomonadota bacterium]
MTYELYIGDRAFSSWSLRGFLMLDAFGLPYTEHLIGLYAGTMAEDMKPLAPARLVPALRTREGTVVGESLAMAETLAERHPEAGLWPQDPAARATARWLCAEMVGGFSALRGECPMQLFRVWDGFAPSDAVMADVARVETLWRHAATFKTTGDWLFGAYSLADVFYAPVAARMIGYNLPISPSARDYALQSLAHPSLQAWRAKGIKMRYDPMPYDLGLPSRDWPV